ncbi:hypothetical protein MP638_006666 [Amoeboaphelidium occidentale]|nr:hypothetical protein MP638_006666 [Amoeboaphelidium occidentale]
MKYSTSTILPLLLSTAVYAQAQNEPVKMSSADLINAYNQTVAETNEKTMQLFSKLEDLEPLFNATGATSPPTVDSLAKDVKNLVQISKTNLGAHVVLLQISGVLIDSLAQQIAQLSLELEQVKYHQVKDKEELLRMIQQKSEGQSEYYGGSSWNQIPPASNHYYQGGYAQQRQSGPWNPTALLPQPSTPGPLNPFPQMGAPGTVPQTAETIPSLNTMERQDGAPLDVNSLFG